MERVIAYIDGFNLYFGIKEMGWVKYKWLNPQALAAKLLVPKQQLVYTKYFTSRVSPGPKGARQATYLDALGTLQAFKSIFGEFQPSPRRCPLCNRDYKAPQEKRTDVNIAVQMMSDALMNEFDTALLVSGDSDLVPPVEAVRRLCPGKRVLVAFPPRRHSNELEKVASYSFPIFENRIKTSLFPPIVMRADGVELHQPPDWK